MKAEYIDFNGDWFKSCGRCGKHYGSGSLNGLSVFFPKDSRKLDGFDAACKMCKKIYRQANKAKELDRWKRHNGPGTEGRKKHLVRDRTRKKYGPAKNNLCKGCNSPAQEWHHMEYKVDSAIPLCEPCHTKADIKPDPR